MNDNTVTVRVWGDYACFTRPEMKVERVSYPVMTPSAARGIIEAIFWEPQIYYLIDAIRVVKRGRWFSFRRNEVQQIISLDSAKTWMKSPEKVRPIQAGGGAPDGTQRNMLALQDVEYLITAEMQLSEIGRDAPHGLPKYLDEIRRRAKSGKCFHRPALGVREFAADFDLEEDPQAALERRTGEISVDWRSQNEDIGLMLYDVFAPEARAQGFRWLRDGEHLADAHARPRSQTKRKAKDVALRHAGRLMKPEAIFFHADLRQAKLDCHPARARFARTQALRSE
ncbi:MAG TPA: type I-C CRISPR-associated protein Cas5c [Blastocatellia bacterium]|nr:type I-C CRISPR-associated protein Cas5c [Blastocatellia bacterium]